MSLAAEMMGAPLAGDGRVTAKISAGRGALGSRGLVCRRVAHVVAVLSVLVGVLAVGAVAAQADAPLPCASPSATAGVICTPEAFVSNDNSGSVTVLNSSTGTVITTLTGFSHPVAVAVTPDGQTAYVVNEGDGTVTPISVATNTAGTAITVGSDPVAVAVTPDGKTAYVTNNDYSGTVTPISVATSTTGTPITVGSNPQAVAVTPDGKTAYVTNYGSGTVTPITVATNTAGTPISVGSGPQAVSVTPDGKTAYVTDSGDNTVTPITVATNTAGTPITVGSFPYAVAVTPDGQTAYVTNLGDNTVTPITVATNTAGSPISVGGGPFAVAVTPDGQTAYVTNSGDNTVTPITVATNTAGTPIPVGSDPIGVAVAPAPVTAYVSNLGANSVTPLAIPTNTTGTSITVGIQPFGSALSPDGTILYVGNSQDHSVSVISTATGGVTATINNVCTGNNGPSAITVTPNGQTAYAVCYSENAVAVIDLTTDTVQTPIAVGSVPNGVAMAPDGSTVYVANVGSGSVSVISTASNTVTGTITGLSSPQGVAVSPDGTTVYVAETGANSVAVVPTTGSASDTVTDTIPVGSSPITVAVTPDGSTVYAPNSSSASVSAISTATDTVVSTISVPGVPYAVAVTPDGQTAYVGQYDQGTNSVTPITVATNTAGPAITGFNRPEGITIAGALEIGNAPVLPQATAGAAYSQQLWSVAGTAPFTYSVTSGSLVGTGLSLSSSGVLSGTPSNIGTLAFTVAVTDSSTYQQVAVKAFTLQVGVASPSISTSQQPASASVGSSIADQATVSGGDTPTGTVTFNLYDNANGTGTPLFTDANEPLSNGTATSNGYTTTATGTDYWVATYNGDSDNNAVSSGNADEPVTVTQAPAITSAASTSFSEGQLGSFTVTTTGSPTASLSDGGATLPGGVMFVDNGDGTATLSGTPAAGSSGSYPFTITASNGALPDAAQSFTLTVGPTVSGVSPASGPTTGGTAITITGTGFASGAVVKIAQGGGLSSTAIAAANVDVVSSTEITATTGGGAKHGTWNLFVTQAGQNSPANSGDEFTYVVPPPTVSGVSPTSGPTTGGTPITITGTGFASGATVEIGQGSGASSTAIAATRVHVVSSTQITATTGGGAKTGAWKVFVTQAGQNSPANTAAEFTYAAPPTVSGVSPTSGPTTGGTPITITGTGFVSGATVEIAQGSGASSTAIAATRVHVVSSTEITATTGGGAKHGTWNLFVTQAGQSSRANAGDQFTYTTGGSKPNARHAPAARHQTGQASPHSLARRRARDQPTAPKHAQRTPTPQL